MINNTKRCFSVQYSYALLTSSLSKLAVEFKIPVTKGTFLSKFSTHDNLFYTGDTPYIYYYNNISISQYKLRCLINDRLKISL